jgi:hypothetical protein
MTRTDEHRHDEHGGGGHHPEASPRLVDRDVNLRAVGLTVVSIVGVTIVAAVLMWWLLAAFLSGAEAADPRPGPAAAAAPRELPPGPRLQARPEVDAARMTAREELILSSYGWTEEGGLRIPIARAIDALAARGEALGDAPAAGTSEATAGQPASQPAAPPSAFGGGAGGPTDQNAGHDQDDGAAAGEGR